MPRPKEVEVPQQVQRKKIPLKTLLTLVAVFLNMAALGGGAYLVYVSTVGYEYPSLSEHQAQDELQKFRDAETKPILYTMEAFTVNLDTNPQRTIRVEVNLEMLDKEGFEEVVNLGPGARDEIVRLLNDKNLDDIDTIQGKLFLKDQIVVTLNRFLQKGVVKDVFFSDFIVQ